MKAGLRFAWTALAVFAAVSSANAAGVSVGGSTLIGTVDYSDTFTVGTAARPDGLYNNNGGGGYNVENIYTNPPATWSPFTNFSFNTGGISTCCGYPGNTGAANGGADVTSGLLQTGGGDFSIPYGLRNDYTVQLDGIIPGDRLDIGSWPNPGAQIGTSNSLNVFFRRDSNGGLPGIGIFNGVTETPVLDGPNGNSGAMVRTGVETDWHNFAVRFNQTDKRLGIYVDQTLKADLDLTVFAGGIYQNFSNAAVGAGGTFVWWGDNFQVGGSGTPPPPPPPPANFPNPGPIASPPAGLVSYWDFDEASGPQSDFTLNYAYDRVDGNHGTFGGGATRVPGLVGLGAARFNNAVGTYVDVGPGVSNNFSATTGIAVEAMIVSNWSGASGDYDEIFRKEDGGNRILLSFQNDANNPGRNPPVNPGPVLSFGLNVGGAYGELDMPLDGTAGITLDELKNGQAHHVVATYDSATGEKSIWIDGVMRWSVNLGAGNLIASGGGTNANIGSVGAFENFDGVIDEVAIWNRSLSEGEIQTHFLNTYFGNNYFVPEPSSWTLAVLGLLAGGQFWRRRTRGLMLAHWIEPR